MTSNMCITPPPYLENTGKQVIEISLSCSNTSFIFIDSTSESDVSINQPAFKKKSSSQSSDLLTIGMINFRNHNLICKCR